MAEQDRAHRKTSLGQAATGAALVGVGAGAKLGLDAHRNHLGVPNPYVAAGNSTRNTLRRWKGQAPKAPKKRAWQTRVHAPDLAGRAGARGLQAVGLPLAAYGLVNAARRKPDKVKQVKHDQLLTQAARSAVYLPAVDAGEDQLKVKKSLSPAQLASLKRVSSANPGQMERSFLRYDARRRSYAATRVRNAEFGRASDRPPTTKESRRLGSTKWAMDGAGGVNAGQSTNAHAQAGAQLRARRSRKLQRTTLFPLSKALTKDEQRKLNAHRSVGRAASLAGGTLGLGALALRSPSAAKTLYRRGIRRGPVTRFLASQESEATKHSNTLGVLAIGTGSAGSFNYAAQQKLERKASVAKARKDHTASGAAVVGAGGVAAGLGVVGGGIPGFKSKQHAAEDMFGATKVKRAGASLAAGRGGIFGWRVAAHQGYTGKTEKENAHYADKPANRRDMFQRGISEGKVPPEHTIIRHMKRGKVGATATLAAGTAASVYGMRRAQRQGVKKDRHDVDAYHGALLGAGATTAAVAHGAALGMERHGRTWARRAGESYDAAQKIIPNSGGWHVAPVDPRMAPNKRVPNVRPVLGDSKAANTALKGKSKAQARAAGRLRGTAQQHAYFGNTYGGQALIARRLRGPALAAAAVGAGGLALQRKKVSKRDDRFLRGYRERISPDAESGYKTLKTGRNRARAQSATAGTMAGLSGWLLHHEAKQVPHNKAGIAVTAASTLGALASAEQNAHTARRYNQKLDKIKAKGRSRRAQGLYGPGRGLHPVDVTSQRAKAYNLAKAIGGAA